MQHDEDDSRLDAILRQIDGEATAEERERAAEAREVDPDLDALASRHERLEEALRTSRTDELSEHEVTAILDSIDRETTPKAFWPRVISLAAAAAVLLAARAVWGSGQGDVERGEAGSAESVVDVAPPGDPFTVALDLDHRLALEMGVEVADADRLDAAFAGIVAETGRHAIALRKDVERALRQTDDERTARGALRFLARSGDATSVRVIDPYLRDAALGELAAETLAQLGPVGWEALAGFVAEDAERSFALAAWPRTDDPRAATLLSDLLTMDGPSSTEIVEVLFDSGAAGVDALLAAADEQRVSTFDLVAAAESRHGLAIVEALEDRDVGIAACLLLGATGAVDGVEPLLGALEERETSGAALHALLRIGDPDGLARIALASSMGRVSRDVLETGLGNRHAAPEQWVAAVEVARTGPSLALDAVAELLLEYSPEGGERAMGRLARCEGLSADLRQRCIEDSGPEAVEELIAFLCEADSGAARLTAQAALVVVDHGRGAEIERLLASTGRGARAVRALEDASERKTTSSVMRLARELRAVMPLETDVEGAFAPREIE
ncbi:MAG: hypothetical protein ACYTFV_15160 [Planctomycetota bacterium]|jgi:hypothetical protein